MVSPDLVPCEVVQASIGCGFPGPINKDLSDTFSRMSSDAHLEMDIVLYILSLIISGFQLHTFSCILSAGWLRMHIFSRASKRILRHDP